MNGIDKQWQCPDDHALMFLDLTAWIRDWNEKHPSTPMAMWTWPQIDYLRCVNGICKFQEAAWTIHRAMLEGK